MLRHWTCVTPYGQALRLMVKRYALGSCALSTLGLKDSSRTYLGGIF
jgi:hypothetical protein